MKRESQMWATLVQAQIITSNLPTSVAMLALARERKLNIQDTRQATQCSNKVLCQVPTCM